MIVTLDIDETAVSHLSPMPSTMADQFGESNLSHLLHDLIDTSAKA